ncbi:hypothetical protein HDU79_003854 [Rhizoclosmatium sp. JEL0117]|nr:hypothetical protein HDU79_003854 [Rhizoclosmatium sp. JEL0117]
MDPKAINSSKTSPTQTPPILNTDTIANLTAAIQNLFVEIKSLPAPIDNKGSPQQQPQSDEIDNPKEYCGSAYEIEEFIAQCHRVYSAWSSQFKTDEMKLLYMISYIRGDAFKWYDVVYAQKNRFPTSLEAFQSELRARFGLEITESQYKAFKNLDRLRQTKSCQAYANKFVELSALVSVNEECKMFMYRRGLKLENELHILGVSPAPSTLAELMDITIRYDDALQLFHSQQSDNSIAACKHKVSANGKLNSKEKRRRRENGLC